MTMTPKVDPIEMSRPFEQPDMRFGAEHYIPAPQIVAPEYVSEDSYDLATDREVFAPTEAIELSPEAYNKDELIQAIRSIAERDALNDHQKYLQPAAAFERADEVYEIFASDTSFSREDAVAEYFYIFTETLLPKAEVQPDEIENIYHGFRQLLEEAALETADA